VKEVNYPKIGIRPVIDGRQGGVRESLEAQTMAMANAAKALIEQALRYADGVPVQCVVASQTIGGRADAEAVRREFLDKNVVATLTVTPCWCYGTETLDLDPMTIKAVWGFNGTERPGAVYLAAVMAAMRPEAPPPITMTFMVGSFRRNSAQEYCYAVHYTGLEQKRQERSGLPT